LFLVAQARRLSETPLRVWLRNVDEVRLFRARRRHVDMALSGGACILHVGVVDGWMSSKHAVLRKHAAAWKLIDNSKNGTKVNGRRYQHALLRDGDLIEMGRTFFVFRAEVRCALDAPQWLDAHWLDAPEGLVTMQPMLSERFNELARLACSKASIVLEGPSGSGKEVLARAIHTLSGRRGPFVPVNCAGLSDGLIESELFGHVRGAFAGAVSHRHGLIAASSGGTLFLDAVGDLPLALQGKLLRVLQEKSLRPVGDTAEVGVDLRVVSATHHDLAQLVHDGKFRAELLDRLGGRFVLPALCQRREDLGLLINAVLERIPDPRAHNAELSTAAMQRLLSYAWPGNVRELQHVLEQAIALAGAAPIELRHLPSRFRASCSVLLRASESATGGDDTMLAPAVTSDPFTYDAFVVYRRSDAVDRAWVEEVMVPSLEGFGLRLCLEHRDFPLGQPRIRALETAVAASRYTIAVLSPGYFDGGIDDFHLLLSLHHSWETGAARFIPILRRACRLPLGVRMTSLLDLTCDPDVASGLRRLASGLRGSPRLYDDQTDRESGLDRSAA
jgi:transcriptional regulator with AAA-type ATPase domain